MSKIKSDYKVNDSVIVVKPGMFYGIGGTVLSNHTDTNFKPLTIILSGTCGIWSFSYSDIELTGKEKSTRIDHKIVEAEANNSVDNLTAVTKPEKRSYKKREAKKEVKPKRAYNRKVKS